MSVSRFAVGLAAGVAIAVVLAGVASVGAPVAAEPAAAPPSQPRAADPAAAARPPAPVPKKGRIAAGVLARAAASRRTKPEGTPIAGAAPEGRDVVESVEVDWGAPPARP